jgi:Ca-activated chloride channel family protein
LHGPGRRSWSSTQTGTHRDFEAHARIVEITAAVESKVGGPTEGLKKEDFILTEDGKEMPIRYFSQGSKRPLTLAILVDTSGSQRDFVEDEVRAASLFIEGLLEGNENRATLVQFDRTVSQLGSLTTSANKLAHALPLLSTQVPHEPSEESEPKGWTVLHDAVYTTAKSVLAPETGRKAIVLLTDGCDFGSRTTLAQAVEQAQRADAVIYSILYTSLSAKPCLPALQNLSDSTGGVVYSVSKNMPLHKIFTQVAQQISTAYELGYIPSPDIAPDSYHKLDLKMKDKHLIVRARHGFYATR